RCRSGFDPFPPVEQGTGEAEELRDRGTGDVGVQDPYVQAATGELDREQRRDGRLSDASLTATDRDDVLNLPFVHPLENSAGGGVRGGSRRRRRRGGRVVGLSVGGHAALTEV